MNRYKAFNSKPYAYWINNDIVSYYENIPIEVFRDLAIQGGFEDGCDIDLVYPYIANTNSIVDIGSAYGRVIRNLLKKGYNGKIIAIERSQNFYNYLKNNYSGKIEIINTGIENIKFKNKVDAILWMWSGINDFSKNEQLPILHLVSSWLKPDGILILETLLHTLKPKNASIDSEKHFIILSEYGTIYSYKTSSDEIESYGEKLGFNYIKHIDYETSTQRQRILHILSRKPI